MSFGKEPALVYLNCLTHTIGNEAYLVRIDMEKGEVDVWDFYNGSSVFHFSNHAVPEWAWRVHDMAVLAEEPQPVWATLDKDFVLLTFSRSGFN